LPDEDDIPAEQAAATPFWSGTISFGLVSIPVSLFPANRSSRIPGRTLGPNGNPLGRRYFSSKTGRELSPKEMVRGYEIEKGRYVLVTDEELDRLAPDQSRDIDLRQFVDGNQIPPLYFERGYFLAPEGDSTKAYLLLAAVMEKTRRAGIATFVMRGKEYLIAITAENGILRAETMRFRDEIRSPHDIGLPEQRNAPEERVRHFIQIIRKHASPELSQNELRDEASAGLRKLLREKQERNQDVVVTAGEKEGGGQAAPNLVAILKHSLAGRTGQRPRHSRAGAVRQPQAIQARSRKRAQR